MSFHPIQPQDLPCAMNAEPGGEVIGYMSLIDWQCELGGVDRGNWIFSSIESLMANHRYAEDFSIIEVEVRIRAIVPDQIISDHLTACAHESQTRRAPKEPTP